MGGCQDGSHAVGGMGLNTPPAAPAAEQEKPSWSGGPGRGSKLKADMK